MADLNQRIIKELKYSAVALSRHKQNREDALQDAFVRILEMPSGQSDYYYIQAGIYAMRNSLNRARAFEERKTINEHKSLMGFITKAPWIYQSGKVDVSNKGRRNEPDLNTGGK